jgi:hypothetical protein
MASPFLVPRSSVSQNRIIPMPARTAAATSRIVRRRPDRQQGQALEILGHALEYLVDSRMYLSKEPKTRADAEAIHILSRCSREVFATCPEVVSLRQRVKSWVSAHLGLGDIQAADTKHEI